MFSQKCTMQLNKVRRIRRVSVQAMGIVCLLALEICGCGREAVPESDVTIQVTGEGFLTFTGGGEADLEEIERLNGEISRIVDEYRETLDDEECKWTVTSRIDSGARILQGTIYIRKEESSLLSGTIESRQIASFAYDTETHIGYTAQDALEADPLTGVDLATRVKKAFNVLEPDAELLQTEMQGFLLNDDATTEFLYMRIEETPDAENPGEDPIERFYLYDPAIDAMAELDWPQ